MSKSNKEIAYVKIRDQIINGQLKPGQPISEEWLCNKLKMSRTPIREALIKLNSENLVQMIGNRGTIVAQITPIDIAEIFQLRILLEPFAAKVCIDNIDMKEVNKIKTETELLLESGDFSKKKNEFGQITKRLHKLHEIIIESARNRRLHIILSNLQSQIIWYLTIAEKIPKRINRSMKEHLIIADAILSADSKRVEKAMGEHIQSNMKDLLEVKNYNLIFKS